MYYGLKCWQLADLPSPPVWTALKWISDDDDFKPLEVLHTKKCEELADMPLASFADFDRLPKLWDNTEKDNENLHWELTENAETCLDWFNLDLLSLRKYETLFRPLPVFVVPDQLSKLRPLPFPTFLKSNPEKDDENLPMEVSKNGVDTKTRMDRFNLAFLSLRKYGTLFRRRPVFVVPDQLSKLRPLPFPTFLKSNPEKDDENLPMEVSKNGVDTKTRMRSILANFERKNCDAEVALIRMASNTLLKDKKIEVPESLLGKIEIAGALTGKDILEQKNDGSNVGIQIVVGKQDHEPSPPESTGNSKFQNGSAHLLLIVSTVLAAVTLLGAFQPPGAYQPPSFPRVKDLSNNPSRMMRLFLFFNSIVFFTSMALITFLLHNLPILPWLLISVSSTIGAYMCAIIANSPPDVVPVLLIGTSIFLAAFLHCVAPQRKSFNNLQWVCSRIHIT
ncbi:hypothetical protein P3X46_009214 [Hevea brasiliensis]|uniref:PGG domain-containing protein n=1 Tax=Hevea brasiliensis TaxID=3981 RepID=A0ABQ9MNS6_HEVBR|nr:hypothetical protein P3X46_009214 [Hevea brasiliensis]